MTFILRSQENGHLCDGGGLGGVRAGTPALLVSYVLLRTAQHYADVGGCLVGLGAPPLLAFFLRACFSNVCSDVPATIPFPFSFSRELVLLIALESRCEWLRVGFK